MLPVHRLSSRRIRIGAVAALSTAALVAPAAAQAGAVAVDRPCYTEGDQVTLGGTGFSPGSTVSISGDGFYGSAPVLANGAFVYQGSAPLQSASKPGSKMVPITVTDSAGVTSSTSVRVAPLAMRVKPSRGNPRKRVTWSFSGFPQGSTIYGHFSRGGRTFSHRFGQAQGACGTLSTRARLLPIASHRVRYGVYRGQIDTRPTLVSGTLPRLEFSLQIFKIYR
ncbi:MAG: hypothetical protein QOG15_2330 [Solirubrobacteraceae bacterium]|jgi:hypothetical protein|nr:hypothetical protein [Solirubrobacteraceae bacterium]